GTGRRRSGMAQRTRRCRARAGRRPLLARPARARNPGRLPPMHGAAMNLANPIPAAQPPAGPAADARTGVVGDFLFGLGEAATYVTGKAAGFDRVQRAGQAVLASSGAVRVAEE